MRTYDEVAALLLRHGDAEAALRVQIKAIEIAGGLGASTLVLDRISAAEALLDEWELDPYWLDFEKLNFSWRQGGDLGRIYRQLERFRGHPPAGSNRRQTSKLHSLGAEVALELGRYGVAKVEATQLLQLAVAPPGNVPLEVNARLSLGRALAGSGWPGEGDMEAAHRVVEWLRARVLREALGQEAQPLTVVEESGRVVEMGRRAAMLRLQIRLAGLLGRSSRQAELDQRLVALSEEAQALGEGEAPARLRQGGFAELRQLEAALGPDEALLSFLLAPEVSLSGRSAGGGMVVCKHPFRKPPLPSAPLA